MALWREIIDKINELTDLQIALRLRKSTEIRTLILKVSPEQQVILLGELLKNVFGETLALQANMIATDFFETIDKGNLEITRNELIQLLENIDPNDLVSLSITQAKLDMITFELEKKKLLTKNLKEEQDEEFAESEEYDKFLQERATIRTTLHAQIEIFIREKCNLSTELSRQELAELRSAKWCGTPISKGTKDRLNQIELANQIINKTAFINIEKDVEEFLQSQNLLVEINIPNVPYKIGASLEEAQVTSKNQVNVAIYFYSGATTIKLDYPLDETTSKKVMPYIK